MSTRVSAATAPLHCMTDAADLYLASAPLCIALTAVADLLIASAAFCIGSKQVRQTSTLHLQPFALHNMCGRPLPCICSPLHCMTAVADLYLASAALHLLLPWC